MQSLRVKLAVGVAALGIAGVSTAAVAHDRSRLDASLSGYDEVSAAVSTISTDASGVFKAAINRNQDEINYILSYSGPFNGPAPSGAPPGTVSQAHIHLGAKGIAGGISAFLCSNLGNGPAGTPACPPTGGTVTGTIRAEQVVGPAAQGILPMEFGELVRALRAGATYANVHTTTYPGGEIRGQIGDKDDRDRDDR